MQTYSSKLYKSILIAAIPLWIQDSKFLVIHRIGSEIQIIDHARLNGVDSQAVLATKWLRNDMAATIPCDANKAENAIKGTEFWIQEVLRPDWRVQRKDVDIALLPRSKQLGDAIQFCYEINGNIIQITSTINRFFIIIRPVREPASSAPISMENALAYAKDMLSCYINTGNEIFNKTKPTLRPTEFGFSAEKNVNGIDWNDYTYWWTNGHVFIFKCKKVLGGTIYGSNSIWFSMLNGENNK